MSSKQCHSFFAILLSSMSGALRDAAEPVALAMGTVEFLAVMLAATRCGPQPQLGRS